MNICFTCDKKYLKYCFVTITSILENNRQGHIDFFIMHPYDVTEDDYKQALEKLKDKYSNFDICFTPMSIDTTKFQINKKSFFNETLLYRLYIPEVFSHLDRMLYIDSDTIIRHDINELYNTELNEHEYIAAVKKNRSSYGRPPPMTYINAGVILMDLNKLRKFEFTTKTLNVLKYKRLRHFDQDAINLVCNGKIKLVDSSYNYCEWVSDTRSTKRESPAIRHFPGTFKNILEGQHIPYSEEWWKYARMSPMSDQIKRPQMPSSWYY